jgi:Predicted Zn-dependent proteases and their inactivated homologs
LKILRSKLDKGIGIRISRNKSIGFSFTSDFSKIEEAVKFAYKIAKNSPQDPDFRSFNEVKARGKLNFLIDNEIKSMDVEKPLQIMADVLKVDLDSRIISLNSDLSIAYLQIGIANSNGIECNDEATFSEFSVEVSSKDGDNYAGSFDFHVSRSLNSLDAISLVKSTCHSAVKNLNKSKIASGKLPVLLDPITTANIVGSSISQGLNAENIQRKRSFLSEDIGNEVFSDKLTIVDDGTLYEGIGSMSFDAEGYPSRRNDLVKKGKIVSVMHNSYTAKKENRESTGNAVRGGDFWNYRSLPSISARNLIIERGSKSWMEILSGIKKGIYVRYTGDSPNTVTGEFTGIINEGYYIEEGEIKFSIVEATFSGKLKDILRNIVEVSMEDRYVGNIRSPYILIQEVSIGGIS